MDEDLYCPKIYNQKPLKMDGWKRIFFCFRDGKISGANC